MADWLHERVDAAGGPEGLFWQRVDAHVVDEPNPSAARAVAAVNDEVVGILVRAELGKDLTEDEAERWASVDLQAVVPRLAVAVRELAIDESDGVKPEDRLAAIKEQPALYRAVYEGGSMPPDAAEQMQEVDSRARVLAEKRRARIRATIVSQANAIMRPRRTPRLSPPPREPARAQSSISRPRGRARRQRRAVRSSVRARAPDPAEPEPPRGRLAEQVRPLTAEER